MRRSVVAVVALVGLAVALLCRGGGDAIVATTPVPTNPTVPSIRVTFHAGWNIVNANVAFQLTRQVNDEPAYTFMAGDRGYQVVTFDAVHPPGSEPAGPGYWVYLPMDLQATVPVFGLTFAQMHINPGWTMVASGTGAPLRVLGADLVLLYDPVTADYQRTDQRIDAGRGAWVYSAAGADITFAL